mgnify:CR=1 FL=1|jgi:hypothetical protein
MNTKLVRFTKYMLDMMFYIGIALTISIPFLFRIFGRYIESFRIYYLFQCVVYILSGILALRIIGELRKMFSTVLSENPFVMENAVSLKKMGKSSFFIALLSIFRLPIAMTPATAVLVIVFSIAGLFSIVLCQVFEQAVQYKLENDYTI